MDLSAFKTRAKTIRGVTYTLLPNVIREAMGWRVSIERVGQSKTRKFFGDQTYGTTQAALDAAHTWLLEQKVRRPYEGIDLTREPCRNLELRRHAEEEGSGRLHRYELRIYASKAVWQRPWMSIYIGNTGSISQVRIRDAIAVLHGRWFEYRRRQLAHGRAAALDMDYSDVPPAPKGSYSTRLMISNVLAWNGKGVGVSFSPAPRPEARAVPDARVRATRRRYRQSHARRALGWEADHSMQGASAGALV